MIEKYTGRYTEMWSSMAATHSLLISIFCLVLITVDSASSNQTRSQTKVGECDALNGNACGFVTCENGGQCSEDPSTADCFKCNCLPGFSGKVCQNAIILPRMYCLSSLPLDFSFI